MEEVCSEPVALLKGHKLKVWEMVESENVLEEFVCQGVDKLKVDYSELCAVEELPEHSFGNVSPTSVENIKFF